MAHLQGKARAEYVRQMFGRIAERYTLMNRLMTFGQDMRWRRFVVRQAKLPAGGKLLDLATGTGDIAFEALKATPNIQAVGADFSLPMMLVGSQSPLGKRVQWCAADALHLPFPDNTFDAVTSGYLIRNVIDIPHTFAEQVRVLKPGGRVVVLDTCPPPNNLLRPFILIHLKVIIPLLGRLISQDGSAYQYLPESTQAFKTPDELAAIMRRAGLKNVQYKTFMFGTMAVHWGEKERVWRFEVSEGMKIWELRRGDIALGKMKLVGLIRPQPIIGDPGSAMGFIWFDTFTPTPAFEEYRPLFSYLTDLLKDDPFWDDEEYWIAHSYNQEKILPLGLTLVSESEEQVLKPLLLRFDEGHRVFASFNKNG